MTRRKLYLSDEMLRLLTDAVSAAEPTGRYAIGGAIGMALHGYARQTSDVDLFIDDRDMIDVLRALREKGFRVATVFDGVHYIAQRPSEEDPDLRIDVLIPSDDPDWSAVQVPERVQLGDLELNVFPIELLVLSKFYGVESNPQFYADIYKLFHRALFRPDRARDILLQMDPDAVPTWDQMIAEMARPKKAMRKKPAKRS